MGGMKIPVKHRGKVIGRYEVPSPDDVFVYQRAFTKEEIGQGVDAHWRTLAARLNSVPRDMVLLARESGAFSKDARIVVERYIYGRNAKWQAA